MPEVIRTSINISPDTLIKIKAIAVRKGTTQNNIINEFIDKGIKSIEKEKNSIISDEDSFIDMIGMVKAKEPTNAVELKKKAQKGE